MGEEEVLDLEEQQELAADESDDIEPATEETTPEAAPEPPKTAAKKKKKKKAAKTAPASAPASAPPTAPAAPLAKATENTMNSDIKRFGLGKWAIARIDPALAAEAITENIGPDGFNYRDLDQLKIPSSGATTWEVPSMEGVTPVRELKTVILYWRSERRYWRSAMGEGLPPDCVSLDAKQGVGAPGGSCATCPMAKFGTKVNDDGSPGRGQACSLVMSMFLLRSNELIPMRFAVPVTSIDPMRKYFLRLASRGIKYWEVVTKLTLEAKANKDGKPYSSVIAGLIGMLSSEYSERVTEFRTGLNKVLEATRVSDSTFTGREETEVDLDEEGVDL